MMQQQTRQLTLKLLRTFLASMVSGWFSPSMAL